MKINYLFLLLLPFVTFGQEVKYRLLDSNLDVIKVKNRYKLSSKERKEMLESIKYVDDVIRYTYEEQLYDLLKMGEFDIRFLGDDYINKPFTGDDLKIPIHYMNRDHGWSTTKFKQLIAESYEKSNNS